MSENLTCNSKSGMLESLVDRTVDRARDAVYVIREIEALIYRPEIVSDSCDENPEPCRITVDEKLEPAHDSLVYSIDRLNKIRDTLRKVLGDMKLQ